ncbi:hypothetical protein V1477_013587 [Vespula maculifrons]|uniref:Uncharacterized protein n=1 Tax=Vespula maculifrons TaxID=7453 RepID=A0ABD2BQ21_VESMC
MIVLLITTVCKERALVSLHRLFVVVHFSLALLSTNRRLDDDDSVISQRVLSHLEVHGYNVDTRRQAYGSDI